MTEPTYRMMLSEILELVDYVSEDGYSWGKDSVLDWLKLHACYPEPSETVLRDVLISHRWVGMEHPSQGHEQPRCYCGWLGGVITTWRSGQDNWVSHVIAALAERGNA